MSEKKKNKIHNPQFITENVPSTITADDIGRVWVDKVNRRFVVGLIDSNNTGILTNIVTDVDTDGLETNISNTYFSQVADVYATIMPQINGDKHYDQGYDFFSDPNFVENSTQEIDDYYSFFYLEVADENSNGYLRTISTTEGDKHIRNAIGADNYVYNSQNRKVVNYSKIYLPFAVKSVIELKFDNKDVVDQGFELQTDKQTLLIYGDPDGFFLNKRVKVRYIS